MFTLGVNGHGGAVFDWSGDGLSLSPAAGGQASLGLHHIITDRFSMQAEFSAGATYFGPHPMAPRGEGPAQVRPDWRLSFVGRHFAVANTSGWTLGGGLYYRQANLQQGRLLQLGADLRAGRFLWTADERFLIVDLHIRAPVIEGLNISEFDTEEARSVPAQWAYPSAGLGIIWAF